MSKNPHRIVFLYSELAGYFLACAETLGNHPEVESVDIVHWPIHPEAPFQFTSTPQCTLHAKALLDRAGLKKLLDQINPTSIVCSGWMDADYNAMAKAWRNRIPVVLTLDNWWTGSLKQWLAIVTSPLFIRRRFNRAWVPGEPQRPFAEKLGFRDKNFATDFYCADPRPFEAVFNARQNLKPSTKLLYVGRYLEFKGVRELWAAFSDLSDELPEWELHCIGSGELWEERLIHPKIYHHGFKQPSELAPFLEDAACFVMPSKKEPWGVVLHEMAIAGIPLVASRSVGAATQFLNTQNGIIFEPNQLANALKHLMRRSEQELLDMGRKSHQIGIETTPQNWAKTLLNLVSS